MVAAVSTTINNPKTTTTQNPRRPPLLPSDPENALANRRPKSREVTSRYLSSSSSSSSSTSSTASRRYPSPLVSRTTSSTAMMTPISSANSTVKRSQSVERRGPVTPRLNSNNSPLDLGTGELSATQKILFSSTRSLSVSFQGESFSLQVSKAKPAPSLSPVSTVRKGTLERRKAVTPARGAADHTENSKPERWPARLRHPNSMSRSVDCTGERKKLGGSGGNVVRALQNSMMDNNNNNNNNNRALFETRLSTDSANAVLDKIQSQKKEDAVIGSDVHSDLVASDTESVSSGSTSEAHESNGVVNQHGPRGIVVPARFWHETSNRLKRQTDPVSPVSRNSGLKTSSTPKLLVPKKFGVDSPVSSPKGVVNMRGLSSPIRSAIRPSSPSKLATSASSSPVRGVSPSRVRNAGVGVSSNLSNVNNTPSVLSFAVDVRRGKIGESRVVDAHLLRLFHNRLLQWRFVNARADAALYAQRLNLERSLYNACIAISKLRESVRAKRTELQLLKQNLKLTCILEGQMMYLEESALVDRDYSSSLLGAIEALRASTLRLPVVGGARADVQNVKDAISSAVDVMQAMASSICSLLSKVGEVNSLVVELANVGGKEHALLGQCKDLLSTIAAMQVKESRLRTHILQMERLPSSLTTKA